MNKQIRQSIVVAFVVAFTALLAYTAFDARQIASSVEQRMAAQSGGAEGERMALATAPIAAVPPPDTPLWVEQDPGSFVMNNQCMQAGGNLRCNFAMHKMLDERVITSPILHAGDFIYAMDFTVRMNQSANVYSTYDGESGVGGRVFENVNILADQFVYTTDYDYWAHLANGDGYVQMCSAAGEIQMTDWVCPWNEVVSE